MPYAAPIEVVQAALHRVGEDVIASLDDASTPAQVATSNYEGIVESVFARHAWTFAKQTLDLTYQGAVTLGPWTHAFVWPAEVMNIRYVMQDGVRLRAGDYSLESGRLLTTSDEDLQIVATVRAPEGDWPADVAEAIVTRMHALFLEALCDKPQDARLLKRDAEDMIRKAILRDKRQEPGVSVAFVPLAEAWRGSRLRRTALYG